MDSKNKNIKYFFNICGSIIDPNAPCMVNSMIVMKNMDIENVKYRLVIYYMLNANDFKINVLLYFRTKSLGKMDSISVINGVIVIQTLSGTYCGAEGDYTSELHLICNSEEVQSYNLVLNIFFCNFFSLEKT